MSASKFPAVIAILIGASAPVLSQDLFLARDGNVFFRSNAPLEIISAQSDVLKGAINLSSLTFAFTVDVASFEGFNSRIQRTHFLENYMEGEKFPTATFTGKIIAPIRFDMHGKAAIRAKGMLRMHGIDQERIIAGTLTRQGSTLRVQASFSVLLDEFGISVPKIVHQKVAKTIYVHVDIQLQRSA